MVSKEFAGKQPASPLVHTGESHGGSAGYGQEPADIMLGEGGCVRMQRILFDSLALRGVSYM